MSPEQPVTKKEEKKEEKPEGKPPRIIHRVCISCNNMFEVTPENYDAKHCPNCHKA